MARIREEHIRAARETPIHDTWSRLGLSDVRTGAAFRSPFREDKKPSCQLGGAKNIFFDHATGESLDPIALVRKARDCSFKEAVAFVLGRPLDDLLESQARPNSQRTSGGGSPRKQAASDPGGGSPPDAIEELARVRGWRPEAIRALGAESRNAQAPREVHFPMRDGAGAVVGFRRRRSDGKIIYSKGNDHIIDAVRCAMLAHEEGNLDQAGEEVVSLKPVLTDPVFL